MKILVQLIWTQGLDLFISVETVVWNFKIMLTFENLTVFKGLSKFAHNAFNGSANFCKMKQSERKLYTTKYHCVKSVCIQSYSGPYFLVFGLTTERYSVYSENTDQNNSEYGYFLRSINRIFYSKSLKSLRSV